MRRGVRVLRACARTRAAGRETASGALPVGLDRVTRCHHARGAERLMAKILIVDDQRNMRTTLSMMLRGAGYEVDEAADGEQGADRGATGAFDVVLTDLRMGTKDGIDVLRATKDTHPLTEVILMTAYGTIESAVEAMRLGAFDYIQKPFTEQELLVKVAKALDNRRLAGEVTFLANEFKDRYRFENIIGRSRAVREVLGRIVRIAPTDAIVLITGESGTGKELVAKAIHANSKRCERPFVPVNCAAITETLLESELFGHAKGSFTGAVSARKGLFEEAEGGTFFFDEIAETPITFQAKLLRAIQESEIRRVGENKAIHVNVRVIAATNQDLLTAIAEKRFRQDLYYRLNVARFQLPPLRERREDIPHLITYFLEKYSRKMGVKPKIQDNITEALAHHDFPGNIRELEHMIEQAVALVQNGLITPDDLMPSPASSPYAPANHGGRALADVVDSAERTAIEGALRESDGSRERAAEVLNISQTTLWRKMTRLGITFESRG
jgi:two-component system response regulator HydG